MKTTLALLLGALVAGCSDDGIHEPSPEPEAVQACAQIDGCELDAGTDAP